MDDEIRLMLMKKAGSLLARRSFSRQELRDRLKRFAEEDAIDGILDRLEQLNLLNDADYAYNFALRHIRHGGWGPARIRHALAARQVGHEAIELALERIRTEQGAGPMLSAYLQKRYGDSRFPSDLKGVRRLMSHLKQRGYDEQSIVNALRGKIPGEFLNRFETGE